MLVTTIVSVAVGLTALYLTFSIFCTAVNELIANLMKLRGRMLVETLARLVDNPDLRSAFYQHGLINSAALASPGAATKSDAGSGAALAPPHIEATSFARALLDSLDAINPPKTLDEVRAAVEGLGDSTVKRVLLSSLASGAQEMEALRADLAKWYDGTMTQLTDAFQQRMGVIGLVTGIIMAGALNIDTIRVASWIMQSNHQSEVTALADAAMGHADHYLAPPANPQDASKTTEPASQEQLAQSFGPLVKETVEGWNKLGEFPIGWPDGSQADTPQAKALQADTSQADGPQATGKGTTFLDWVTFVVLKLLGIGLTAIAISFGAPRWFDVLALLTGKKAAPAPQDAKTKP